MKLMMITPYFYPKVGGLENYAYNISSGLKEVFGWELVIITSNHENPSKYKEEFVNGMKIYRLPKMLKLSNTPISPLWYFQIKNIIHKEKPDIINGHTPVPFISDVAARAAKKLNVPFVLTYHNDIIKDSLILKLIINFYNFILGKKTLMISNKIIATSNYYARNSRNLSPLLNKISVVSPGTFVNKKTIIKNKNFILFVGQLDRTHRHKGLDYLIKAFSIVSKDFPKVKLKIVGKGNDLKYYSDLINDLKINNKVIFNGFASESQLTNFYNSCSLLVLPSINNSEGFGMVLIEAMAHRKPVIGSNVGGIPFIIKDGVNGYLIQAKNYKMLSEAIRRILLKPALGNKLGNNGFKMVEKYFTWRVQVNKTNKLFMKFKK